MNKVEVKSDRPELASLNGKWVIKLGPGKPVGGKPTTQIFTGGGVKHTVFADELVETKSG